MALLPPGGMKKAPKKSYKEFKTDLLIAVDFGQCSAEEVEESIQEWYSTYKLAGYSSIVRFCKEQIPTDRDNSVLWLSDRGIAILELQKKFNNYNPHPVF